MSTWALKIENRITWTAVTLVSPVLWVNRSQISFGIWPEDHVYSHHHNIIVINMLPGKPSEPLFSFALNCQIWSGEIFFRTVNFGVVKVANYCHHCPWKCITPHLRAHSIKETEGAINRWLLTLIHRKITQKSQTAINISHSVSCCKLSYCWHLTLGIIMAFLGSGPWTLPFLISCCLEMDLRMNQTSSCRSLCPIKKKKKKCQFHDLICFTWSLSI